MTLSRRTRARLMRELLARGATESQHRREWSEAFLYWIVTVLLTILALYLFTQI